MPWSSLNRSQVPAEVVYLIDHLEQYGKRWDLVGTDEECDAFYIGNLELVFEFVE